MSEYTSDRMPDGMSEYMSDRMPDIMSEYASDRTSVGGDHSKKVILCGSMAHQAPDFGRLGNKFTKARMARRCVPRHRKMTKAGARFGLVSF